MEIKIPQLGEGLHEARILRFLKQPGDPVAQDEPIYEMETDKAIMEIESPAAGVLEAWTAREDEVVPIGTVIGRITTESRGERQAASEEAKPLSPPDSRPPIPEGLPNRLVPPRTKAYAREKGLSDAVLLRLAEAAGGKLLPEAIDRYLQAEQEKGRKGAGEKPEHRAPTAERRAPEYEDVPIPPPQRTLVYRMQRGTQAVIPATMEMPVEWSAVEAVREQFRQRETTPSLRQEGSRVEPTQFLLFAWCVAQAAKSHPRFRSALLNETTLRQYAHLHLGIAVARPGDELLLARVPDADALSFGEFVAAAQDAIRRARDGEDQAADAMPLSLTNMAGTGVRRGTPVVVAPAVGTLFIGTPYDEAYPLPGGGVGFRRMASMVLTFDHRIVNGKGAADFLTEVKQRVEGLREEFASLLE